MYQDKKIKLPLKTKLGYGVASIGDSIAYDFIATFLLFFLTDLAGVTPAFAGTIILLSVAWDAITDPLIGVWTDRSKSKYGKRRPFILSSAIPLGLAMVLLFNVVGFEGIGKNLYYLIMAIIFWTSYTAFSIPYFTLGGCITLDNDEKTKLSSIRQALNYIGVFCATSLALLLVGGFSDIGYKESTAWLYTAIILAIITSLSILITWRATRGKEIVLEQEGEEGSIFKDLLEILKSKTYVLIMLAALFYIIAYTWTTASTVYFASHVLLLSEQATSLIYLTVTIVGGLLTISLAKVAVRFDKRSVYIAFLLLTGVAMVAAKFIGITSLLGACFYMVFISFSGAAYWTLIFNFLYDAADVDEFKFGRRRDGAIISFYSFFYKLGGAIAGQVAGIVLEINGYDASAAVQGIDAANAITSLFTIYPGIFMILSGVMIMFYPISKPRYMALQTALELKKEGKEYSTEGFEELL